MFLGIREARTRQLSMIITTSTPTLKVGCSAYGARRPLTVVSRALTAARNSTFSLKYGYPTFLEHNLFTTVCCIVTVTTSTTVAVVLEFVWLSVSR